MRSAKSSDIDTHETMMRTQDDRGKVKGSFVVNLPEEMGFNVSSRNQTMWSDN